MTEEEQAVMISEEPYQTPDWYDVRQYKAPITARGYIRFVNLRPDLNSPQVWICDGCGERVTKSKQAKHARDHR